MPGFRVSQTGSGELDLSFSVTSPRSGEQKELFSFDKGLQMSALDGHLPRYSSKRQKPLFGGWWGKRFGLSPSPSVTSRRPKHVIGAGDVQKYDEIKKECVAAGALFEDPDFDADDETIFHSRKPPKPFVWKRPHEIVQEPHFITEGVSRFDVKQGELGDCWLLAAIANLTLYDEVLARVVPHDQSFTKDYCGAFHFKFWQYGHWVDVIVDDRLPTYNGRLVFMHSDDANEFWSALLEKAYAKLHGSYEALKGGSTSEAMEDFTGGLAEIFDLKEDIPANLYGILKKGTQRCSLMGCSLEADPSQFEARMPNGLIRGHAYSITSVKQVKATLPSGKSGDVQLLRIRNPWGNEAEWKGPWGDSSPEWKCISEKDKKALGLTFAADGEFWMAYSDFLKNFEKVEICNLGPEAAEAVRGENKASKHWANQSFDGSWVRGATAGGCRNFLDTFAYNPQFQISLTDPDDDDDDDKCTCIVALLQKHRRKQRLTGAGEMLTVGYALYSVETGELAAPLDREYFRTHVSVARSQSFINLREVCCRFRLAAGHYVIVPTTFEPNEEGEFMLRVFSEKKCGLTDVEECTGYTPPPVAAAAAPASAPPVDDESAQKLEKFFESLAGTDLEIDAWELQKVLTFALKKEFKFDEFSIDTCRSMIALVDLSRSGKLDLLEFKELWHTIRLWKTVFKKHDRDNSGTIDSFELRDALRKTGYSLHTRVLTALVLRYASKDGQIEFDNFIGCAVKLKTMIEVFVERDPKSTGQAMFDLDAWVELTMYA